MLKGKYSFLEPRFHASDEGLETVARSVAAARAGLLVSV